MSTCSGKCCAVFPFPASSDELRARWAKWPDTSIYSRDDLFIADMLIPLSLEDAAYRADGYGFDPVDTLDLVEWARTGNTGLYTCKHFDGSECTVYEERPRMCAEFPYAKTCHHKGCDYRITGSQLGEYVTRVYPEQAVVGAR